MITSVAGHRTDAVNPPARGHEGRSACAATVHGRDDGADAAVPAAERHTAFADFDSVFAGRIAETDEFYNRLQHGTPGRRRPARAAAGVCRHDLDEAVLSL